jgi:hypothetical protein
VRPRWKPPEQPRLSTSVAVWLLALVCVVGFAQAILLFPHFIEPSSDGNCFEAEVNLPEREVSVLLADGEPALVLKATLDHPEAADLDADALDQALFPGKGRHRWFLLRVFGAARSPVALDLLADPILLLTEDGERIPPADLTGAFRERGDRLSPYLRMQLLSLGAGEARVLLGPGERAAILLAYPEAARAAILLGGSMAGREFKPVRVLKDDLDDSLQGLDAGPETEDL